MRGVGDARKDVFQSPKIAQLNPIAIAKASRQTATKPIRSARLFVCRVRFDMISTTFLSRVSRPGLAVTDGNRPDIAPLSMSEPV